VYQLDDEERADIREALAEIDRGEVASDEEVKPVFDGLRKFRK
jgi:predicted transcriptional regulator